MTNHPARNTNAKIARQYVLGLTGVERVRINDGAVHAYGTMPNSQSIGWYLAGYVDDLAAMASAVSADDRYDIDAAADRVSDGLANCAECDDPAAITDDMIAALRADAGEHGDLEQVAICDRALAGDSDARAECWRVIDDARAQS